MVSLQQADLKVELETDIETALWDKLAVNASLNGLTAVLGCRNGDVLNTSYGRLLLGKCCDEVEGVMKASGLSRPRNLLSRVERVVRLNAANFSSMHQDIVARRTTEIDYINGFVLKKGTQLGVPTPYNHVIFNLVKMKEKIQP